MSIKKFVDFVDDIEKSVNEFIKNAASVISLISPNTIGLISDNLNQINISKVNLEKDKKSFKSIIHLDLILKSILNTVDLLKSENIIKDVLVGRSFTVVAELKGLRDKIVNSTVEINNLYENCINELVNTLPTDDDKDIIRSMPHILMRMTDKMDDYLSKKIINETIDNMLKLNVQPSETAKIVMRTWPRTAEIVNVEPTVSIVTGQNLKYNLQGLVNANWVAKHKLNESKTAGLSKLAIERCSTIESMPFIKDCKFNEVESNEPTITYGDITYKLEYTPLLLTRQLSYAQILANEAFINIELNPPEEELNYKKDESFKIDMLTRVKSSCINETRKWLRNKEEFKFQKVSDLIKDLMKVCAIGIKDSLTTTSSDVNKLLINMAAITDSYKRVNAALTNNLNTRFGEIDINTLLNKNDFAEIMISLVDKSIDEINRQPSVFDLLL
jgi:predicted nucleic acid-binding protein